MRDPTGYRRQMLRTFRNLIIVLVGLSSGLTALFAGAALALVAVATALGLVFGTALAVIALPRPGETEPADPRLQWEK